jgi:AcrR family transcriptional regulator
MFKTKFKHVLIIAKADIIRQGREIDMATRDPKERILEAAERLFTEQGLEAVSLRAVTTEAEVNLAAVNYYFGSKAALLQAITQRFFLAVNMEQLRRLNEITAKTATPTVEDILTAYAIPIFQAFDSPRGREWVQAWMIARSAKIAGPVNLMVGEGGAEVTSRYYEVFRRVLPHLPSDELWWRFERAHGLLMANQGMRATNMPPGMNRGRTQRDERAWLIIFLVGGFQMAATRIQED